MRDFNTMLRRDGSKFSRALGGVSVVVYPDGNTNGPSVTVWAILRWRKQEAQRFSDSSSMGRGAITSATDYVEVEIPNHPQYGVTEIHRQQMVVMVPSQENGNPSPHTVTQILYQDAGMWVLKCVGGAGNK